MLEWPSFIILLTIILLLGSLADLLIINEEWNKIKARLFIASLKIKKSSLNELIFIIASRVVRTLERAVTTFPKTVAKPEKRFILLSLLIVAVFIILTLYIVIFKWQYLFTLVLIFPIFFISLFWFLLILIHESVTKGKWNNRFDNYWRIFTKTAIISAAVTFFAIFLGFELFSYFKVSEYWFNNVDNNGVIKHAAYIGIINYPFDFFSLAITYWCVKKISRKQGAYYLYPILDVLCSLLLSSILYILLLSISAGSFRFGIFINDITQLYINGPNNTGYDLIYLTPVILSTFIPISLLAAVFFILIFYKTVSIFLSRFLHVLSEKEGSIFKDIAATISVFCALINAITLQ